MSDANLSSQQNGWYDVGNQLTLECSKRGEAVKGYFRFNIPNGGWDNLWYKTSHARSHIISSRGCPRSDRRRIPRVREFLRTS
jgi:hypothetical protein